MSELKLKAISEGEFLSTPKSLRLFSHENARRFAVLNQKITTPLAISWRSDLIEPSIIEDEKSSVFWIAVDDRCAGVSFEAEVVFLIATNTLVLSLEKCLGGIILITETQSIVVNSNYTIRSIIEFPDIPQKYLIKDNELTVTFTDCDAITFLI